MGKRKESPSCCSPHNISEGGLRREAYELRSGASRTRSGLIRVRTAPACPCRSKSPPPPAGSPPTPTSGRPDPLGPSTRTIGTSPASPPSKILNLEGDSSVLPRPENEKDSINPPVPLNPSYPRLDSETLGIRYLDAFGRALGAVANHLAAGGTDVELERIKREVGVTDELLREHDFSTNLEQYRQKCRRVATPFIESCFAEVNKTTNQADDFELLAVLFVENEVPYGVNRIHMHFRATRKSMSDPVYESPGLYCAVLYPLGKGQCHILGCVLLENDCPGGSKTLCKCLNDARYNAKTLGDLLSLPHEVDYGEIKRRVRELWLKTGALSKIEEETRKREEKMRRRKEGILN